LPECHACFECICYFITKARITYLVFIAMEDYPFPILFQSLETPWVPSELCLSFVRTADYLFLSIPGENAIIDNKQSDCDCDDSKNRQDEHGRVLFLNPKGKSQQFEEDGVYKPYDSHGTVITLNILNLGWLCSCIETHRLF
jgi:hypothetical protein